MSKQILVTGGTGFIGAHTVVELIEQGYEPIIVDNLSNSHAFVKDNIETLTARKVKFYQVDCTDEAAIEGVFSENEIQGVIHFAASKAVGESVENPLKYYHNNIQGLVVMLGMCEKFSVPNFVFSSSCTVYGDTDKSPITEDAPIAIPASPYGNTKKVGEEIISDFAKSGAKLKSVLLRYFNPIGAHSSGLIGELPIGTPSNLVPFITQTAIGIREKLTVFGGDYSTPDGSCIRDYIHVVDLAKAHIAAMELADNMSNSVEVFNIGTGNGNSVLEVVKTFEEVTVQKLNYVVGPRRAGDVEAIFADTTKSENKLGWKAELSLAQALKDAWYWQKKLEENGK